MKTKLYYVMDTMCGWCYGFSDVISNIHDKYKNSFELIVVPAGMWVGNNVQIMNEKLGHLIKDHNTTITKVTGKRFGIDFEINVLQKEAYVLDSLPGAKAITVMQRLKEDKLFSYMKQIYQAFYIEGQDMNDWRVYAELAVKYGVDKEAFKAEFHSKENLQKVEDAFNFAKKLRVTTYPTLVATQLDEIRLLTEGYKTFDEITVILDRLPN